MMEHDPIQTIPARTPPPVILWYRVFCGGMTVLYLLLLLLGLFMIVAPALLMGALESVRVESMPEQIGNMVMGVVYAVLGFVFFMIYLAGACLPVRRWSWVAGLVLIALSFTSCCCLPVAVPLLIFWITPETKAWFTTDES